MVVHEQGTRLSRAAVAILPNMSLMTLFAFAESPFKPPSHYNTSLLLSLCFQAIHYSLPSPCLCLPLRRPLTMDFADGIHWQAQ